MDILRRLLFPIPAELPCCIRLYEGSNSFTSDMLVCSRLRGSKPDSDFLSTDSVVTGPKENRDEYSAHVLLRSLHSGWHGNRGRRTCTRCTAFLHFRALSSTEVERMLSCCRITPARLCDTQQALVMFQKSNMPSRGTCAYGRLPRCNALIPAPTFREGMSGVGIGGPRGIQPLICELDAYAAHCAGEQCWVSRTNLSTYSRCLQGMDDDLYQRCVRVREIPLTVPNHDCGFRAAASTVVIHDGG